MMNWLYYLLEANLYLILFYGFYRLFLQKETFYALNRYFLITTSVSAFILPLFQLGFLKPSENLVADYILNDEIQQIYTPAESFRTPIKASIFNFENILIAIYLIVSILLLAKFLYSLGKIMKMKKSSFKTLENGVRLFELNDSKVAFSFFNLLFLDPLLSEKSTILKHELVHIRQKHSIDVMFYEILHIINWFNPFSYLIKREIKVIHEYLADEETTSYEVEKYAYALFLIKNSSDAQNLTFTNQIFSSSILKRRISMLNQKKSGSWARLKLLLVIPIIGGAISVSTMAFSKDYAIVVFSSTEKVRSRNILQETPPFKEKPKLLIADTKKNSTSLKAKKLSAIKKNEQTEKLPQTYFYVRNTYYEGKAIKTDPRFIVVNGKGIEDNKLFVGVQNTESVKIINQSVAIKKYGNKGKNGAVEITGDNIKTIDKFPTPPPFPKLSLDRSKNELLVIPDSDYETKTLTIYNNHGEVVYNTMDYKNDWNGKQGNYGNFASPLSKGSYQYFMKIAGEPLKNKRGAIEMKD
ncbi:hypothetical protein EA772_20920 [Pedobacter sp. G11]|uniref:M56 family metallopeptidase n=1 Tax=Pedobacter sp. G11 TaxID=2482728 RepID=UPI000F5E238C|nr:M56 family metallopeptidase [Pedobacter sp. G11]AZI27686.1 hypothetical protein EA772_20920 [Pedobacter sp. G11]